MKLINNNVATKKSNQFTTQELVYYCKDYAMKAGLEIKQEKDYSFTIHGNNIEFSSNRLYPQHNQYLDMVVFEVNITAIKLNGKWVNFR